MATSKSTGREFIPHGAGFTDHVSQRDAMDWDHPSTQKKSAADRQRLVDTICAKAIDAAKFLFNARAEMARLSQRTSATDPSSSANPRTRIEPGHPVASDRTNNTDNEDHVRESKERLKRAETTWKEVREELLVSRDQLINDVKAAESANVPTNNTHYSSHFEKSRTLHEAEAKILRSLQVQIEDALAEAEGIIAGKQPSGSSEKTADFPHQTNFPLAVSGQKFGQGVPGLARLTGRLRFETYDGEQIVDVAGAVQMTPRRAAAPPGRRKGKPS